MAANLPSIDGIPVRAEVWPATVEELTRAVRRAFETGEVMAPVGGGTKLHLGNPLREPVTAVRLHRLRGVVEYEPDNMTVSVRAGTPLAELQDTLRGKNQFLPLDPPLPQKATLGGIVACNSSGPLRFRYGTVRDMLTGVKIVHADGTRTKAGGKLVKNVSGYDMCKLYTGALGTLGILTELTFKVQPRPEARATVRLVYPSLEEALAAAQAFLRADLTPEAMEIWNRPALLDLAPEEDVPWTLMLRFGDLEEAVRWQVDRLRRLAPERKGKILAVLGDDESELFWNRAASARMEDGPGDTMKLKCSVLYRCAAETAYKMQEAGERLGARTSLYCHAGTYVIYGSYRWEEPHRAEDLHREIAGLRGHCVAAGGHLIVERIRPEAKAGLDVWGYAAPALEIMRRIKHEFDPKGLLNPGRFVGGI